MLIVFIVVFSVSCNSGENQDEIKETILQTDRSFSNHSKEHGMVDAFYLYADERCVILRDSLYPVVGKESLKELLGEPSAGNPSLTWDPIFVDVSESGDMGYTYGTYKVSLTGEEEQIVSEGCYVSIWKKQLDGSWKYVLDTGTKGLGN